MLRNLSTRADRAPGAEPPRLDARTEGAKGPNAKASMHNGRVEALAPEESGTKPSGWYRGTTGGVSATCCVDVMATCSALRSAYRVLAWTRSARWS